MPYDVVVTGAGPVGCTAARLCAGQGLSTLCIEEHGTIGYPVQCAGLLSNTAFAECGVSGRSVLHTVSGARIVTGSGSDLLIDAETAKASVVDRGALDREMAEAAADAGAEFRLKTAVYDVRDTTVLTRGINGHEEIKFKILIAADGPRSTITRLYGMERAKVYLSGIQADIPGEGDPRFVELYPDASPEFFGWKIPVADGRARIGLCGQTQVRERFFSFLQETPPSAKKEGNKKAGGKQEQEYWCKKATNARNKIENAGRDVIEREEDISREKTKSVRTSRKINTLQARLKKAKDHRSSAERDLKDIESEAHRKGIPPGWLRCQFD